MVQWEDPSQPHVQPYTCPIRLQCKKRPTQSRLSKLNQEEIMLQQLMESTETEYESDLISSGNLKKFYVYFHLLSTCNTVPTCILSSESNTPTHTISASTFTASQYVLPYLINSPHPLYNSTLYQSKMMTLPLLFHPWTTQKPMAVTT
jgi:hypothetical protein